MKHEKTIVFEQELSWRPDLHKAYVDRLSASRIRAAKQCVKLRFFDEQCQMYINETSVLPRYKRQFLNHFLKSCNHFIKTLLTILKNEFIIFYILSFPGMNLHWFVLKGPK